MNVLMSQNLYNKSGAKCLYRVENDNDKKFSLNLHVMFEKAENKQ